MAGKLNLYNLGTQGVDLTRSVIHANEGTLRQAQNAVPDPRGEFGGIAKRDGLTNINETTIGGAVQGVVDVPLPAKPRVFFSTRVGGTPDSWIFTDDGLASEAQDVTVKPAPPDFHTISSVGGGLSFGAVNQACVVNNQLFYVGADYSPPDTPPPIRVFDGRIDREFARMPVNPDTGGYVRFVFSMLPYRGTIYIITADNGAVVGSAWTLNPITGQIQKLGSTSPAGYLPQCLAVSVGRLFVGTSAESGNITNGGRIYTVPIHGSTTFVQDHELPQGHVHSLAEYKGLLYAATSGDNSANAGQVIVRSLAGAWTTSKAGTDPSDHFQSLVVFNDELYATMRTPTDLVIWQFDGSTWSDVLTVAGGSGSWCLFTAAGHIYAIDQAVSSSKGVYVSDNGTDWTLVNDFQPGSQYGMIGVD